jgi:sulfite exporter TauE/SafE
VTLVAGVLVASLLGSVHCAAMCGAFVCAYNARNGHGLFDNSRANAAYHGGRLVSYTALGAVAGALGAGADRIGALVGIGRVAAALAGLLLVAWAVATIAMSFGVHAGPWRTLAARSVPGSMQRVFGGALARARHASPVVRAGSFGLLTTLIPCGWLYVFVATAAGTASAAAGAGVMAVFWVGTVPALTLVSVGATRILGPIARRMPIVAAALVLALGVLALSGRVQPGFARTPSPASLHTGHGN